jgi:hypothetical protein
LVHKGFIIGGCGLLVTGYRMKVRSWPTRAGRIHPSLISPIRGAQRRTRIDGPIASDEGLLTLRIVQRLPIDPTRHGQLDSRGQASNNP